MEVRRESEAEANAGFAGAALESGAEGGFRKRSISEQ
jgi:hypothetical protein